MTWAMRWPRFPTDWRICSGRSRDNLVHAAYLDTYNRRPTPVECRQPHPTLYPGILLQRLRHAHAEHAEKLATQGFYRRAKPSERLHLLDDAELRANLGGLIGRIARSHHQTIQEVVDEFRITPGTSTILPRAWPIDALRIAFLLRAADAAHVDNRRAPALIHAVRRPAGTSELHWTFQSHLLRPSVRHEQLLFSTSSPFTPEERDAWWLCHDTLQTVDAELRGIDEALRRERQLRFAARSVAGIGSPESLSALIKTSGWTPIDVRIRVTDVAGVIERFGGKKLYGDNPLFALRELIANAADAVRARRVLERRPSDWGRIIVRLGQDGQDWWLEVEDEGIGMSEAVLRGPLLDFGLSYWRSDLARNEHPGLLSSSFEPTGQFGIGFFSVFMLGKRVKVTTRRYDGGHDAGRVLELSQEAGAQPFIRHVTQGRNSEGVPGGGTRVRISLENKPWHRAGLLGRLLRREQIRQNRMGRRPDSDATPQGLVQKLAMAASHVAPTLDVSLECVVEPETRPLKALTANDWETLPFEALVKRLTAGRGPEGFSRPGEIRRDGRLIARLQLAIPRSYSQASMTVRGLSTLDSHGDYWGVILADNPNLSRKEAEPLITFEELRSFVEGTLPWALSWEHLEWETRGFLAQLQLSLGFRPEDIPCFIQGNRYVSMSNLRRWLQRVPLGDVVRIGLLEDFEMQDRYSNNSVQMIGFDECLGRWKQPGDLILAGRSYYAPPELSPYSPPQLLPGLPSVPEKALSFTSVNGSSVPFSRAAFLVEAAAQAWDVDLQDLSKTAQLVRDEPIGLVDKQKISTPTLHIARPASKARRAAPKKAASKRRVRRK